MVDTRYEHKLILTMSPKELRDLADKMEKVWPTLRPGQSTFVELLHYPKDDRGTWVELHLDQQYFHDREAAR